MTKRIIYIGSPCKLSIKNSQLVIENHSTGERNTLPVEDIAVINLDNPQILLNNYFLQFCSENNVAIITNSKYHLPNGLMLPLAGHHQQSLTFRKQIAVKKPLKNQLWKRIVIQKIKNQAFVLKLNGLKWEFLQSLSETVKSNDSKNNEAQSSRYYWKKLFGNDFIRDPDGDPPNDMLNYGYSLIRSTIARELVSAGLHPTIGIHHKSQYNQYCLADDMMEPYRPFVDKKVKEIIGNDYDLFEIDKNIKKELMQITIDVIKINGQEKTMLNAMQDTCASLVKSFFEEKEQLVLPELYETKPI